jgi:23S rRNA (adenine2503-C2)-methyltransferase
MIKNRIAGQSLDELTSWLKNLGEPGYRGRQIYKWIYQQKATTFGEMTDLPQKLRQSLEEKAWIGVPSVLRRQRASDGTVKLLLELEDGQSVEAVLMQYAMDEGRDRLTCCVSTQVGCPIGCPFCATGHSGFIRNLDAGEIVGQVLALQREAEDQFFEGMNVVFMGMGEPLLNYPEVLKSILILHDPQGINIGYRRITVSTGGVVSGINELAREGLPVNLAVSLHAPNNQLRNKLVPLNRKYPLEVLIPACREYFEDTRRRLTFEYVLLKDINDTKQCAEELAALITGMPALINLIPANPTSGEYKKSSAEQIRLFAKILRDRGLQVTIREERGGEISAACGQLRGLAKV